MNGTTICKYDVIYESAVLLRVGRANYRFNHEYYYYNNEVANISSPYRRCST